MSSESLLEDAPSVEKTETSNRHRAAVAVAVVLGAVVLFVATEAIPYHIDELRQVASYEKPYAEIIELSIGRQQPPLNSLLGASLQQVLGVGDWQQRLVSVLAGIGTLVLAGTITLRGGFRYGAAATVLVLALSPVMVAVTAYARPYALPLFLSFFFLLMADIWLTSRSLWAAAGLSVSALLLPLSRSSEPLVLLAATITILSVFMVWRRSDSWPGSPLLPIGISALALLAVGLPMLLRLRDSLDRYSTLGFDLSQAIDRAWSELPQAFFTLFPLWPIVLILVVAAFAESASRRLLLPSWWFWVLVAVPISYVVVFYLTSEPFVPFFDRFTYTWWPPIAVAVGALVAGLHEPAADGSPRRIVQLGAGALVVVFLAASAVSVVSNLRETTVDASMDLEVRPDWEAASTAIAAGTAADAFVLFDIAVPVGRYRQAFAGSGRYIDDTRLIASAIEVILRVPEMSHRRPVAVITLGEAVDIDGWTHSAVDQFHLYTPQSEARGVEGAVGAMLVMAEAHGPDTGATWALAAAALAAANGDPTLACSIIAETRGDGDESLAGRIDGFIAGHGALNEVAMGCGPG